jgi:hypothetical protein
VRTAGERALLVATPFAAILAVALGLGLGSHGAVRAAVVVASPRSGAGTGLAWQIAAFDEERGVRAPMAHALVALVARGGGVDARWNGTTNADGIAEARLDVPDGPAHVEVRAGAATLAAGDVSVAGIASDAAESRAVAPWMPFAHRSGPVALDVAVLGGRAAPGFPAVVCVHATDAGTHADVAGAAIDVVDDPSVAAAAPGRTDAAGWAVLRVTPVGLALALEVRARRPADGSSGVSGDWIGGLHASPGGAEIVTRPRWSPGDAIAIDVVTPTARRTAYLEVDDARGRAWAAALDLEPGTDGMGRASVTAPKLAPGLYWAIVASDPGGAEALGPGTTARPFFVASSDESALAFRRDAEGCGARRDVRDAEEALWPCLALAHPAPAPRRVLLDGVTAQRALAAGKRARGLAVALGAIFVAALLEAALLARSSARARGRIGSLVVATLVALLGFALLASFLARVA